MAVTSKAVGHRRGKAVNRHVETGAANTLLTVSLSLSRAVRVLVVTVKYSAAPTQAGVTAAIDSGAGAGYDAVLNTGSANAQVTVYAPDAVLMLGDDDALVVTAPAGGVGITAAVAVYTEEG